MQFGSDAEAEKKRVPEQKTGDGEDQTRRDGWLEAKTSREFPERPHPDGGLSSPCLFPVRGACGLYPPPGTGGFQEIGRLWGQWRVGDRA